MASDPRDYLKPEYYLSTKTVVAFARVKARTNRSNDIRQMARELLEAQAQLAALQLAANRLVSTMETCHICQCLLLLEEDPVHCENCSYDCEAHEGEECIPVYELHRQLKDTINAPAPQRKDE